MVEGEKTGRIGNFSTPCYTCAEKGDYTKLGISPGKCIDPNIIENLWKIHRPWKKDPNQRKFCGCAISKDIGISDTCPHACTYCYATRDENLANKRYREHDMKSPTLFGNGVIDIDEDDNEKDLQMMLFK